MQIRLMLLMFIITSAVCTVDYINRFTKEQPVLADESDIKNDFAINTKVLNDSIVKKIFDAHPKTPPKEVQVDDTPKKQVPVVRLKSDELSINGKLYRLSGVFVSKQSSFAVIESRDAKSGGGLKKKSLHIKEALDGFTVDFIQTDRVKMSNKSSTLIFEMYKKPSLTG